MAVGTRMQQRRGLESEWSTSDYVLAAGEIGLTLDTGIAKFGDGVNGWNALPIAFDGLYLPILGKAADSELLDGVGIESLVKFADTSTTPTADKFVQRTATGTIKAATAAASDDVTPKAQMDSAILDSRKIGASRVITSAATLALTDANCAVYVNHTSITAQVVVTIPPNSSVAFPLGTVIEITAYSDGGAKIAPGAGVTLNGATNAFPNWGTIRLVKSGTDAWYGISINAGRRLPTIKALRSSGGQSYGGAYAFVPYNSIDATETYNPDNEWFSVPGSGLPTARRIVINKDGEYLFNVNFASQGTASITYLRIAKMTVDNSTSGMKLIGVSSIQAVCCVSMRKRVVAGESFGVHHGFASGCIDKADDEAAGGDPNNFMITRLSD